MPTNMKFLSVNQVNTTTQIGVDSNTSMVSNLFDRDENTIWSSVGYAGATATTITFTPSVAIAINRLYLKNCNFGQFQAFYDLTTTNTFNPAITANSATAENMYFEFATQTVSSVSIKITDTYPASAEKFLGELYVGNETYELEVNPSAENYNPYIFKKTSELEMADGGMVSVLFGEKFRTDISLSFVSATAQDALRSIWSSDSAFVFMPFPISNVYLASGSWNGLAYEMNWLGNFDAMKYSTNNTSKGYTINMSLAETPS